jgi:hypothetical protein
MEVGIILSYVSLAVNYIAFLIFYFSNKRNNSILANLFMLLSVCECIGSYITAIFYQDFAMTVYNYSIRKIFTFVTFGGIHDKDNVYETYIKTGRLAVTEENEPLSPAYMNILRLNSSIYSAVLTFSYMLELFYRLEVICILKYPISNWSKRHKIYLSISYVLSLVSFISSYITDFGEAAEAGYITYRGIYMKLIQGQIFNGVLIILVFLASVASIIYILLLIFAKSSFYTKERSRFGMKHSIYMISYSFFYIYSDIALLIDSDKNLVVSTTLVASAGTILALLRLTEIYDVLKCCKKKKSTELNPDNTINISTNNTEHIMVSSSSSQVTNTYLIEYMFYIIQGILKIGKEVSKNKLQKYTIE